MTEQVLDFVFQNPKKRKAACLEVPIKLVEEFPPREIVMNLFDMCPVCFVIMDTNHRRGSFKVNHIYFHQHCLVNSPRIYSAPGAKIKLALSGEHAVKPNNQIRTCPVKGYGKDYLKKVCSETPMEIVQHIERKE